MILLVGEIAKSTASREAFSLQEEWNQLDKVDLSLMFSAPIHVSGVATNISEGLIEVSGSISTIFETQCARCLKNVSVNMDIPFVERFAKTVPANEYSDVYVYSDDKLLLDQIIQENILLNIPMRVLCTQSCKGFCHKCGIDLNDSHCSCRDEVVENTITAFKVLRNDKEEV